MFEWQRPHNVLIFNSCTFHTVLPLDLILWSTSGGKKIVMAIFAFYSLVKYIYRFKDMNVLFHSDLKPDIHVYFSVTWPSIKHKFHFCFHCYSPAFSALLFVCLSIIIEDCQTFCSIFIHKETRKKCEQSKSTEVSVPEALMWSCGMSHVSILVNTCESACKITDQITFATIVHSSKEYL